MNIKTYVNRTNYNMGSPRRLRSWEKIEMNEGVEWGRN